MPTLLSDLINAIPVAGREDVISPESHNSVRDAIVAIVTELGGPVASRNVTLTFVPTFLEVPDPSTPGSHFANWFINIGFAQKAFSEFSTGAEGWLPLQLPDRSQIQQLSVLFGGTGRVSQMSVKLQRQFIEGFSSTETLADVKVEPVALQPLMERSAPFSVAHSQADIVNNDKCKYLARADVDLREGSIVNIFAIRVDCRLG